MKPRTLLALIVVLAAVVGLVLWSVVGEDEGTTPAAEGTAAASATRSGTSASAPSAEPRKRPRGRAWIALGTGDVGGSVLEYGTEKPLAGVVVTLAAPAPGPDRTLETRTAADGTFRFGEVPNYDDWTVRVDAPEPLADLEQGGVNVVEDQRTDLGVLYVTPAFSVPGIVVDDRGDPVEGAEVRALRARTGATQMDILRLIREFPVESPAVDKATTAKDGRFRLTKASPGSYDVKVVAKGFQVLVERQVLVTPDAERRELRFVVAKGHVLDGRVVRKGPGSVAGLPVVAMHQPQGEMDLLGLDRTFTTTDEQGRFRLDGLGAGPYVVGAAPPGEPFAIHADVRIPDVTWLELTIAGDAWLEGRVTGKGGAPLAGAQVYLVDIQERPTIANTRTSEDGRYVVRGLRSGPVRLLLVQAEGYAQWPTDVVSAFQGRGDEALVLQPGRNEKDVSLEPGGTVRGVVVSREDEKPIEGARVELGTPLALFGGARGATTDAQGRFELQSVPLGASVLLASKDGWFQPGVTAMGVGMVFRSAGKPRPDTGTGFVVSIAEPGQVVERTIALSRGSTIAGRVVTPDGSPVAGARVELVHESEGMLDGIRALFGAADPRMTDAEGRFEVPAPAPGSRARVVAKAPEYLDGRSDVVAAGAAGTRSEGLVVQLRVGATLEGKVLTQAGTPLEGASVRWAQTQGRNEWRARMELERAKPVTTDAEGRFRVDHVEPGNVTVQASHPTHLTQTLRDVAVTEGAPKALDVRLAPGGVLEGRVLGPDDKPRSGATVRLAYQRNPGERDDDPLTVESRQLTTDAEGRFRAENLAVGRFEARAEASGAAPSEAVLARTGGDAVVLRLAAPLRIAGVVRVQGAPAAGIEVEVRRAARTDASGNPSGGGEEVASVETDATGRFVAEDLPPGTYDLAVASGGWESGRGTNAIGKTVAGVAAGNEAVAVDLEPGLVIAGTLTLADGTPAPEGWIHVRQVDKDGRSVAGGVSKGRGFEDGAFEIGGLPAGSYDVDVNVDGQGRKRLRVEAGTTGLAVALGAGGKLRGRVLLDDGSPASGVWVYAHADGSGNGAPTDLDGWYVIPGLDAGVYRVDANWGSGRSRRSGSAEGIAVRAGDTCEAPVITLRAPQ